MAIFPAEWLVWAVKMLRSNMGIWSVCLGIAGILAFAHYMITELVIPTLMQLVTGIGDIQTAFAGLPDLPESNFTVIDGIAYANAVIPVAEALTLFGLYYTFIVAVIVFRWVKSFIPTLSN